jgi:hypothetical protein
MKMPMLNRLPVCLQSQRPICLMIFLFLFCAAQNGWADNPASSCSNTTVNGAANNCYTVTPLPGTVSIDGLLTGAEWTGAPSKDLTGDFSARIRFKRSGNNLHFLISVDDAGFNASDRIELYFDPLHNHATTADDIIFRINRGNTDHRRISNNGATNVVWLPGANLDIEDGSAGGAPPDFATGWAAEVTITDAATDLGTSDLPAILGFTVLVINQNTSDQTSWPDPFPAPAATWANLKTRYPIEYMIVLDQSGSMLSQSKWDNAKKAANFLANAMAILREATYFEDKLGVVTFSWNNAANTDQTTTPKPLNTISAFPLGNYVDAAPAVSPPLSNYYTPIGKGLDAAFTALGTGVEETQRVVLLLSDGLHNRPTTQVPLLPAYLIYDPCAAVAGWGICPGGTDIRVQVNTVALGEDWGVDTALLTNIKNRFAGALETTYNITTNVEDLKEYFIASLDELYQMNLAFSGSSGTEFTVNSGERKLVVILSWTTPASAVSFGLQQKTNPADPWTTVLCNVSATDATVGYAICSVNNPAAGTWRAVDGMGNPLLTADRQFVLVDLNLRARFAIDQQVHGTGQDIVLTAALNEAGVTVTNDSINHPVKATVLIKRPGEGFGTYVSVHTLGSCEPRSPELPPIRRDRPGLMRGTFSSQAFATAIAQPSNIDVKPDRFAKFDSLSKLCQKDSLIYVEDPGIDLYDDGTHGDVTANDGIYTLRFLNTQYEGSYVFRFKASGISPSGSAFSRVKTIAEYVRVEVDPAATDFDSREYQRSGNIVVREYHVTPRDRFQGYLGPGYTDQIQFKTTAGSFISPVIDYNNGIYSQLLRYDESKDRPVVTPTVQGKPLKPLRVFKPFELVLPFAGRFFFDDSLGLEDGTVVGARLGYRLTNQLTIEGEGGVTFTKNVAGNSGNVIQALANLHYDIYPLRIGQWIPYVTGGAGYVFFRGFGVNDETFAFHGGVGSTFQLSNSFGVRVDGRVFRFNEVMRIGKTTNIQATGGLVFWF